MISLNGCQVESILSADNADKIFLRALTAPGRTSRRGASELQERRRRRAQWQDGPGRQTRPTFSREAGARREGTRAGSTTGNRTGARKPIAGQSKDAADRGAARGDRQAAGTTIAR